jgi:hypothetical protein
LFIFKPEFLKIVADLQTSLAAEAQLTEEQWLEEPLNVGK